MKNLILSPRSLYLSAMVWAVADHHGPFLFWSGREKQQKSLGIAILNDFMSGFAGLTEPYISFPLQFTESIISKKLAALRSQRALGF